MTRKICVFTGTRAEYGLLRWIMQGIEDAPGLTLQIIASGTHLSPEFGLTYREIEKDGFTIDRKVDMQLSSDTAIGVTHSMGIGLAAFGETLAELAPDMLVVLGDRYELLCVVAAALVARVPVAHLHGGEITEGAFDDAIRHAITKMSHLHFVAAEEYRDRVIQLGEQPDRVFTVGGLGLDAIARLKLLTRARVEERLNIRFAAKNLLVTFHPATLENNPPEQQFAELLAALDDLDDTLLLFTFPNADPGSRGIRVALAKYVKNHPRAHSFESMGQLAYLSCLREVDGVVGNSSSGIIEAPALRKATVNIGSRQRGRLMAQSVINCAPERKAIAQALEQLYSADFRARLQSVSNPYGEPGASTKVVDVIARTPAAGLLNKTFYDLPMGGRVT